jgi:hypothetical protein
METKLANPGPLGLFGFALTTWLLSMINAGWFGGEALPMVLACAFAFGGTAQFVAGMMEMPRGNTFGFVAFCGYGAFWWSFALFVAFFAGKVPGAFVGWYLLLWGVFTAFMWVASLTKHMGQKLIFGFLTLTFLALASKDLFAAPAMGVLGGYLGLVTAALAFYVAAAEVINESYGRTVLPY